MQLPWDEHFYEIVIPAWQAYLTAEQRLTEAVHSGNEELSRRAGYDALREGGAATIYVHHFAEVAMRARPRWIPGNIRSARELWSWVGGHCTMLRTDRPVADVELCGDVADALKHAILTRNLDARNDLRLEPQRGRNDVQPRVCRHRSGARPANRTLRERRAAASRLTPGRSHTRAHFWAGCAFPASERRPDSSLGGC